MVAIYACAKEIASQGIKLIMIRRMIKSETLIKKRKQSHLLPQGIVREDNVHTLERMKLILINLAIPMDLPNATKEILSINSINNNTITIKIRSHYVYK